MNITGITNIPTITSDMEPATNASSSANTAAPDLDPGDPEAYLYDVGTRMFIVVDLVFVVLGCVGNLLTLLVSLRKKLRRSPVSVFIAALAVSDMLVLLLDFINNWLSLQLDVYLMANPSFCCFHRWFFNVAYTASAWLVAGVALERFMAVWFPLHAKLWCTVKRTVIIVIAIPILLGVIYAYNFWTWHVNSDFKCAVRPQHEPFMNDVSPWLTGALYSYIPLTVIICSSVAIVVRLTKASASRASLTGDVATDTNTRKVTITVLTVSTAFCCLTIPLTIWYIWVFATQQFIEQTARIVFIEICILIVGLSNHSINFFLYVLTSERFRTELVAMFAFLPRLKSGKGPGQASEDKTVSTQKTSVALSEQSVSTVSK